MLHPLTLQYLTILVTVRGGAIIFCRILAPPPPDTTILNYLNDRERGGAIIFCRILAPPNDPPPPQMPQTLTILMTEREGVPLSVCRILAPPPNSKILYYLNDSDEGRYYFCRILASPNALQPLTPQYLTSLMIERGGRHYRL